MERDFLGCQHVGKCHTILEREKTREMERIMKLVDSMSEVERIAYVAGYEDASKYNLKVINIRRGLLN